MNKKIILCCMGVVFMLVAITMVSAANDVQSAEKKESPLFNVRQNNAIDKENTKKVVYNFLMKFVRNRVFQSMPPLLIDHYNLRQQIVQKDTVYDFSCKSYYTCWNSYPC